jgi:DNA-binding transcriptional regulator YdaS (Cro superfamily)
MANLAWKKSGKSHCGYYTATPHGAWYIDMLLSAANASKKENREVCQRHAWHATAVQEFGIVLEVFGGAANLSHILQVDSSQVSRWRLGRVSIPAKRCVQIFDLHEFIPELRPDLEFAEEKTGWRWSKRPLSEEG